MPSVTRWALPCGAVVIKYRMAPSTYRWLRYEKGQSLDGGDYTSHKSLKEAKNIKGAMQIHERGAGHV